MSTRAFADRLVEAVEAKGCPVCFGLDPQLELFPAPLAPLASSRSREQAASAVERLCDEALDAVADVVAVIKPQVAFFERLGPPGWTALERVVGSAHRRGLLVIADAKRGDIASTAAAYADYLLGDPEPSGAAGTDRGQQALPGLGADAVTVNPYLGGDSLDPFLRHVERGKGFYLLTRTSNPGSRDLQDLAVTGEGQTGARPLYLHVAAIAERCGARSLGEHGFSSVGVVVGATRPEQAQRLRAEHPGLLFLVPGYGAQGAGPEDVAAVFDARGRGAIVNASRSLLFAHRSERYRELGEARWAEAARRECIAMRDAIVEAQKRLVAR